MASYVLRLGVNWSRDLFLISKNGIEKSNILSFALPFFLVHLNLHAQVLSGWKVGSGEEWTDPLPDPHSDQQSSDLAAQCT